MIPMSTLVPAIQKELGSFFSTEAHSDADIIRYVCSAIRYFSSYRDFKFLEMRQIVTYSTANVEQTISYNVKTKSVRSYPDFSTDYNPVDMNYFYSSSSNDRDIGIWDSTFVSKVTGTFQVIYQGIPTFPVTNTDVIDLPDFVYDIILGLSIYYGYMDIELYDKAQNRMSIAQASMNAFAQRDTQKRIATNERL